MANEIVELPLEEVLALPVYPTADIFPMLLDEAKPPVGSDCLTIHQFADQIAKEGVREPLVIWNGQLIDGRNRREAARIVEKRSPGSIETVPVIYADFANDEEADAFILAAALDRRSMGKDQLACSAVLYWPIYEGRVGKGAENSAHLGKTRDLLATRFHVNKDKVQQARSLYNNDRVKFLQVASGRQRIQIPSPGQNTSDSDPVARALNDINNGFNKATSGLADLLNSATGESLTKGLSNFETKLDRLNEHWKLVEEKHGR